MQTAGYNGAHKVILNTAGVNILAQLTLYILTDLIVLRLQTLVLPDELLEVQLIVELNFLQL